MTDVIVETKDGERMHFYIDDGRPAIVYIRAGGTITVRRYDPAIDQRVRRLAGQYQP